MVQGDADFINAEKDESPETCHHMKNTSVKNGVTIASDQLSRCLAFHSFFLFVKVKGKL